MRFGHYLNIVNYCSPNKISQKERIGDKNLSFCYFEDKLIIYLSFSSDYFVLLFFFLYLCSITRFYSTFMVRKELSETEIAESIPDLWQPLTQEQREFLAQNFTIQKYKRMRRYTAKEKLRCTLCVFLVEK